MHFLKSALACGCQKSIQGDNNPLSFCFWWLHTLRNTLFLISLWWLGDGMLQPSKLKYSATMDKPKELNRRILPAYSTCTNSALLITAHFKDIPVVKLNSISLKHHAVAVTTGSTLAPTMETPLTPSFTIKTWDQLVACVCVTSAVIAAWHSGQFNTFLLY